MTLQSWKAAYVTMRTQAQQEASMGQTHISSYQGQGGQLQDSSTYWDRGYTQKSLSLILTLRVCGFVAEEGMGLRSDSGSWSLDQQTAHTLSSLGGLVVHLTPTPKENSLEITR